MVLFPNGDKGMALNLEASVVKAALFGSEREVVQGDYVFRTQSIISIPTGAFLLAGEFVIAKQLASAAAKGLKPVLKNPKTWSILSAGLLLSGFTRSLPANTEIGVNPRKGFSITRGPSSGANAEPLDAFNPLEMLDGISAYDTIMFWVFPLVFIVFSV